MSDQYPEDRRRYLLRRKKGDLLFAACMLLGSALLLSQLGEQTDWIRRTKLSAQPRFWPAVSLASMTFCALIYLFGAWLDPARGVREANLGEELRLWLRSLEFAGWMMGYVYLTPLIGYLSASVVFCVLLTLRMGYRGLRMPAVAAGFAVVTVLLFKTFLQVRIPGGAVYNWFPPALRNFLIVNF